MERRILVRSMMERRPLIRPLPLHEGDCTAILRTFPDNSVDSVVTDPPYGLGFMGKQWDRVLSPVATWIEVLRVLKPGGHLLSFGGTRTHHRMTCAVEDAGFEIRDTLMWLYGTGFPKSLDVSKAIDKAAGAVREVVRTSAGMSSLGVMHDDAWVPGGSRIDVTAPATPEAAQWYGWGTGLKPAWEPIVLARKPLGGTIVANVLRHGVGGINIDACRVKYQDEADAASAIPRGRCTSGNLVGGGVDTDRVDFERPEQKKGRFPANVLHDGSDEVLDSFAVFGESKGNGKSGLVEYSQPDMRGDNFNRATGKQTRQGMRFGDSGTAARFFYCAKASIKERNGSKHPAVKPLVLMRYLCRLITPVGGIVLDPFAGTGTTGQAAMLEGFKYILIERDPQYCIDIRNRLQQRVAL